MLGRLELRNVGPAPTLAIDHAGRSRRPGNRAGHLSLPYLERRFPLLARELRRQGRM